MTTPLAIAPDPLANLAPHARWVLTRAKPDPDALALVRPEATLEALYNAWISAEMYPSAIRLIGAVLPIRECIWWSWVSARHALQMPGAVPATQAIHDTLGAIERWIVQPDEDARRAAWDLGNVAGIDTDVGLIATAVFFSGVTIAPPNSPVVPPPPGAGSPLATGVVIMAAQSHEDPEQIPVTLAAFASQGLEIIKRVGGWEVALQRAYTLHEKQMQEYQRAVAPANGGGR